MRRTVKLDSEYFADGIDPVSTGVQMGSIPSKAQNQTHVTSPGRDDGWARDEVEAPRSTIDDAFGDA